MSLPGAALTWQKQMTAWADKQAYCNLVLYPASAA